MNHDAKHGDGLKRFYDQTLMSEYVSVSESDRSLLDSKLKFINVGGQSKVG